MEHLITFVKEQIEELRHQITVYKGDKTPKRLTPYYYHDKGKLEAYLEVLIKIQELRG